VNLVHRLLKNHVGEATAWRAYALFSGAALEHLGQPCEPQYLHESSETYEHLGTVPVASFDLHRRYEAALAARRVVVEPEAADVVLDFDYAAPPPVVWDWLNDPARRMIFSPHNHWSSGDRPGGRTGAGARNHCAHGKNETTTETILDWKPFEYYTCDQAPDPKKKIRMMYQLTPLDEGRRTHLRVTVVGMLKGLPRWMERLVVRTMFRFMGYSQPWTDLEGIIARAMAEEQAQAGPDAARLPEAAGA